MKHSFIPQCLALACCSLPTFGQSIPDFQFHAELAAGLASDSPKQSITADFNGDGLDDFAVMNAGISSGAGEISVQVSDGSGNMGDDHPFGVAGQATGFSVGDIDNDGDLDFVVTSGGTFIPIFVNINLNDGFAEFGNSFSSMTVLGPGFKTAGGIALGDFDEDGFLDFAVASGLNGIQDRMEIYIGDGLGGFALLGPSILVRQGSMLQAGDVNSDGHIDLVLPSKTLLGAGDGSFPTETNIGGGSKFTLTDADGDGDLDILSPFRSAPTGTVRFNDGTGQFSTFVSVTAPWNIADLKAADVNLDGAMDLVACGTTVGNSVNQGGVFLGKQDGGFWPMLALGAGRDPQTIAVGDWDNDGFQDFAVCSGRVQNPFATVWVQDPTALWTDIGFSLAGSAGAPLLGVVGADPGSNISLSLDGVPAGSRGWFVLGDTDSQLPLLGGVLVPKPVLKLAFTADANGMASSGVQWPLGFPVGFRVFAQAVIIDRSSSNGLLSFSNAVLGIQR